VVIIFSIILAGHSLRGLNKVGTLIVIALAAAATIALLISCLTTLRTAWQLPKEEQTPEEQARGKATSGDSG
jgi:hypothetical protein